MKLSWKKDYNNISTLIWWLNANKFVLKSFFKKHNKSNFSQNFEVFFLFKLNFNKHHIHDCLELYASHRQRTCLMRFNKSLKKESKQRILIQVWLLLKLWVRDKLWNGVFCEMIHWEVFLVPNDLLNGFFQQKSFSFCLTMNCIPTIFSVLT